MSVALPYHHKRTRCRLCRSIDLRCALHLTPTPLANAFITEDMLHVPQVLYPLDIYRCGECGHLQLLDIIDPEVLFSHYVYVSGTSSVMVEYLRNQAAEVIRRAGLKPGDLVVEFGSNDGTLLRFFKEAGMRVLGVDPAANVAPSMDDVPTIPDFFSVPVAQRIRSEYGTAKAICAYNVCAHIDDLQSIVDGVRILLSDDGQFVFEVGYLYDVYSKTLFDTIYHEHVDFHHIEPLQKFFSVNRLSLIHVERSDIQGGALVGYVAIGTQRAEDSVAALIDMERKAGLDKAETYTRWGSAIRCKGEELSILLRGLKAAGKSIAAYGAPAKATTLMYHFGLDARIIDYIVDDNPIKQGLFTPGLHVPVLAPSVLYERKPDYVLILAWNFADSLIARHSEYAGDLSRFITPLPNLVLSGSRVCSI